MRLRTLAIVLALLATGIFLPPERKLPSPQLRLVDEAGERPCPPSFARVRTVAGRRATAGALWEDLSRAAAAAGPVGCAIALGGFGFVVLLAGLWWGGFRCGLRRALVCFALGVPLAVGLLYSSCFLDGVEILLGEEASGFVKANLHTQTDRTTGLLPPRELVRWHYRRGFRVLNVSDRENPAGGQEAQRAALAMAPDPPLVVTVGVELRGDPDLILVHERTPTQRGADLADTAARVHAQGSALFVAHPWERGRNRTLDELFSMGLDGAEIVNGVIHGGSAVFESVRRHGGALIGTTDCKFGPDVLAITLLPAGAAHRAPDVVAALRAGATRVLYVSSGEAITGAAWEAGLPTRGLRSGGRMLLATPRKRRLVWFAWLAVVTLVWWGATRPPRPGGRRGRRRLGTGPARAIFLACCLVEFLLPVTLHWVVRAAIGSIPVVFLLAVAALVAVPLLMTTHVLACPEEAA